MDEKIITILRQKILLIRIHAEIVKDSIFLQSWLTLIWISGELISGDYSVITRIPLSVLMAGEKLTSFDFKMQHSGKLDGEVDAYKTMLLFQVPESIITF